MGVKGPVERRLEQFGRVWGLVFGSFGEISKDLHALMRIVARANAEKHWRAIGANSSELAQAASANMIKRVWASAIDQANAGLILQQLRKVGSTVPGQPQWMTGLERECGLLQCHHRAQRVR